MINPFIAHVLTFMSGGYVKKPGRVQVSLECGKEQCRHLAVITPRVNCHQLHIVVSGSVSATCHN